MSRRLILIMFLLLLTKVDENSVVNGQNWKRIRNMKSDMHHQQEDQYFRSSVGSYLFRYDTGNTQHQSFREERRSADGTVYGYYGYVDARNTLRVTEYVADGKGFRQMTTLRYLVNDH